MGEPRLTKNYGLAGGVCTHYPHRQARRHIEQIDGLLTKMLDADPTRYYIADFNELLEARFVLMCARDST